MGVMYLKSFIQKLLALATVVAIIGIVYLIFLYPGHNYTKRVPGGEPFDLKSSLMSSMPKDISISLESTKFSTSISITEDELEDLILSDANESIDAIDIVMGNNRADIYIRQKIWKYIPVEANLTFAPKIEDGKAKLVLTESKLGKLELDKEKVLNKVKDNDAPFFDVRPSAGEIILEDQEMKDLVRVEEVKFGSRQLQIGFQVEVNNMEDVLKLVEILKQN